MISPIEKRDCGKLAELHALCFPRGWTSMEIAALVAQPETLALKTADTKIDGFILVRCALDEAEILTLAICPGARRRGLAIQLVETVEGQVRQKRCTQLYLEVSRRNAAAIALYDRLGFARSGLRPGYYSDGSDALIMEKSLTR